MFRLKKALLNISSFLKYQTTFLGQTKGTEISPRYAAFEMTTVGKNKKSSSFQNCFQN